MMEKNYLDDGNAVTEPWENQQPAPSARLNTNQRFPRDAGVATSLSAATASNNHMFDHSNPSYPSDNNANMQQRHPRYRQQPDQPSHSMMPSMQQAEEDPFAPIALDHVHGLGSKQERFAAGETKDACGGNFVPRKTLASRRFATGQVGLRGDSMSEMEGGPSHGMPPQQLRPLGDSSSSCSSVGASGAGTFPAAAGGAAAGAVAPSVPKTHDESLSRFAAALREQEWSNDTSSSSVYDALPFDPSFALGGREAQQPAPSQAHLEGVTSFRQPERVENNLFNATNTRDTPPLQLRQRQQQLLQQEREQVQQQMQRQRQQQQYQRMQQQQQQHQHDSLLGNMNDSILFQQQHGNNNSSMNSSMMRPQQVNNYPDVMGSGSMNTAVASAGGNFGQQAFHASAVSSNMMMGRSNLDMGVQQQHHQQQQQSLMGPSSFLGNSLGGPQHGQFQMGQQHQHQPMQNPIQQRVLAAFEEEEEEDSRFKPFHEEKWAVRYKELVNFHSEHGHAAVPHTYPPNPQLARWVKRQRRQCKLLRERKPSTMTNERLDLLNRVEFIWDSHEVNWREKLMALDLFRREHGHCNVPSNFIDKKLATWVKCQRRQYKLYWDGKGSAMCTKRIMALEQRGFEWEIRHTNPKTPKTAAPANEEGDRKAQSHDTSEPLSPTPLAEDK